MNEISRKPAHIVTKLASARQHQKPGRTAAGRSPPPCRSARPSARSARVSRALPPALLGPASPSLNYGTLEGADVYLYWSQSLVLDHVSRVRFLQFPERLARRTIVAVQGRSFCSGPPHKCQWWRESGCINTSPPCTSQRRAWWRIVDDRAGCY